MKPLAKKSRSVAVYDRIFRENMEAALPGIIEQVLKLKIISTEEIADDLQHTKERKPDVLKKVTDSIGNSFVLHLEWQVKNEADMAYRMLEYRAMLQRKYKLQAKQYVLYIGSGKLNMASGIEQEDLVFKYKIITLSEIDYLLFLQSHKPEEKILAILAGFRSDKPELAISSILNEVGSSARGDFARSRYFKQLRILAQLRKFDIKILETMESISTFFSDEKDILFRIGEAKGERKGERKNSIAIARELKKEGMPLDFIVRTTKLSLEEVEKL